jgi:hypothetical protein
MIEDVWALSPLQEGLLFHALFDAQAVDVYNAQVAFVLRGALDTSALQAAVRTLLARHANLRAGFRQIRDGMTVQVVWREVDLPWQECDLSDLSGPEQAAAVERVLAGGEPKNVAASFLMDLGLR